MQRENRLPLVLLGIVGVLLVAVMATFVVMAVRAERDKDQELTAHGAAIEDASEALTEAENLINLRLNSGSNEFEATTEGTVSCWYSYPHGDDDPNDFLRCGPLMFADSEPDTHWVNFPVSFRSDGETTRVDRGTSFNRRTWTLGAEELLRPDKATPPDSDDLQRPPAGVADPGALGMTSGLMMDLDGVDHDEGQIIGAGHELVVLALGTTDRAMISSDHVDRPGVYEAAEGEHWLVVQVTVDQDHMAEPVEYAVKVGDDELPLEDVTSALHLGIDNDLSHNPDHESAIVISVPTDAEEIELVVADEVITQSWSFTDLHRSDDIPEILYRENIVAEIDQTQVMPYGLRDLHVMPGVPGFDDSVPFGDLEVSVEIREARLTYGLKVGGLSGNGDVVTASDSDRALLYLSDVRELWGPNAAYSAYQLFSDDVVLTLEDGTEIDTRSGPGSMIDPIGLVGEHEGEPETVLGTELFWDVPADIRSATVTISPRDGGNDALFDYEFQGGSISFDIEFD